MDFKHIHFIVNPAAGKEEPIVSYINRIFEDSNIDWDISVTKKETNLASLVRDVVGTTDIIAVYGGDGTVTSIASILHGTRKPLAIIPGGTANVMAKELNIPTDTEIALELLRYKKVRLMPVDMGIVNEKPFLLRVNLGLMADMVLQTDRKLKDDFGQIAYGFTAIKTIADAKEIHFSMEIDGEHIEDAGVALTITNSGNIGIGDLSLLPGISVTDGLLDVILLQHADISSLLKVAGSTLLQTDTDAYKHWKGKHIVINMREPHSYVCDDCEDEAQQLNISVAPHSIQMIVPL